jgi:hypothetical protein
MSLSVEELLKTRYKLIADYPGNYLPIGHIFYLIQDEYHGQYPHLFKKLEWHEDRSENDMPEYVKLNPENTIGGNRVFKVVDVHTYIDGIGLEIDDENNRILACKYLLPASFIEYETYINSLK